jgi:hypothetical protein
VLSARQPGKELLQSVATIILGGLISSALLDHVVTPALCYRVGGWEFARRPRLRKLAYSVPDGGTGTAWQRPRRDSNTRPAA